MERPFSVIYGKDKDVIPILINIHTAVKSPLILDCTYNTGKMWKGSDFKPIKMDKDSSLSNLDVAADFMVMPFPDKTFDVLVFDPPHMPTSAASKNSSNIYKKIYGITANDKYRSGFNISPMFKPFLLEAKRVLKKEGIILAKLIDLVHNHRYQWQHIDFINDVFDVGMTPCDMIIKVDPAAGHLQSSKWKNVKHVRRCHCYWIIVRNSLKCESKKW